MRNTDITDPRIRLAPRVLWIALCFALLLPAALVAKVVPGHYVVELTEAAPAERAAREVRGRRKDTLRDHRATVLAQQRFVRRLLESRGAVAYGSVDTVANALLVRISDERAGMLASLEGVSRVYRVYEMKAHLERAINLHQVPQGWARTGGADRAGEGIKIGIIDSGIDLTHEGFVDQSIPMPEGFPRVNQQSDLQFTSNKVIVARSYTSVFFGDADGSARDVNSHGTAVAMAAAGVIRATPDGPVSGVAPKAWLGSYKVIRLDGTTRSDLILKAFDDAVRDGMDVINMSLGSVLVSKPEDEIMVRVFERASMMGVVVVVAAGNEGPGRYTLGSSAIPRAALSVGASPNDRTIGSAFELETGSSYFARPSDGVQPTEPISAPVFDVEQLDPSGLACEAFPVGSFTGHIAFILRGDCTFEEKLNNAQAGGAVATVIYTHAQEPDPVPWTVGGATLPGVMISNEDGLDAKSQLATGGNLSGTINLNAVRSIDPNRVSSFSSRGPSTGLAIKPDLLAVGEHLNTAKLGGGFEITQGTSFSAPIVAGAVAALKAARPGYSAAHYRSFLVNAAQPLVIEGSGVAPVQVAGGGMLNLDRSAEVTVTAQPVSVSFGDTTGPLTRRVTISNLSTVAETFAITAQPFDGGPAPESSESLILIPPGRAQTVTFALSPLGVAPGEYQGFLWVRGSRTGTDIHIPYWYAIPSGIPAHLNIVWADETGASGSLRRRAIGLRVTDSAGIPITASLPTVTVDSGGGGVVSVFLDEDTSPGLFAVTVSLGSTPGPNLFTIEAGDQTKQVTIEGL